jgi:zinc ribbon protein
MKMRKVNWLVVGIISIVVILLLFGGGMMMGGWGYYGRGMMGGPGMMGNWGYSLFGWIGMLFMWLIPVGIIVLMVLGVIWLVQNAGNFTPPSSQSPCPNCGKGVQADWQNCPYCGTALK